jgi:hypothetical protein
MRIFFTTGGKTTVTPQYFYENNQAKKILIHEIWHGEIKHIPDYE